MSDDQLQGQPPEPQEEPSTKSQGADDGQDGEQDGQPAEQQPEPQEEQPVEEEQTVEIDGEQVPISKVKEWKKSTMLESDYRKKTERLAEKERQLARSGKVVDKPKANVDMEKPEIKEAVKTLREMGFVTQDEVEQKLRMTEVVQQDQRQLSALLEANPDLKRFKSALEAIGKNSGEAWEDIIVKHGFAEKTALKRAKASRPVVGSPSAKTPAKEKTPGQMSDAEYDKWRREKGIGNSRSSFRKASR